MAAIALILFLPLAEPLRDDVETIELNVVYTLEGKETFRQWIFWDRGHVRAWRMAKGQHVLHERGGFILRWQDGETFREVRAPTYVEIHSQTDREMDERSRLEKERRRPLLMERPACSAAP